MSVEPVHACREGCASCVTNEPRTPHGHLPVALCEVCTPPTPDPLIGGDKAAKVQRIDRYTIEVEGHPVRATVEQEARIAAMDAEQRARFRTVMGGG